jgi:hypothetical protein
MPQRAVFSAADQFGVKTILGVTTSLSLTWHLRKKTGKLQRRFACQDTSLGSARSSHLAGLDLI